MPLLLLIQELQHGESQFNVEGKIGGDAPLSARGRQYAAALPGLIKDNIGGAGLTVSLITFLRVRSFAYLIIGLDFNLAKDH